MDSRVNRKWLAIELKRALMEATLTVCGPKDCHGCAPFARECVKGIVSETTGRPLDSALPVLSTPTAAGPGLPACPSSAPPLVVASRHEGTAAPVVEGRRFRARFIKQGRLRFLGHLDLYRLLLPDLRLRAHARLRARHAMVPARARNGTALVPPA